MPRRSKAITRCEPTEREVMPAQGAKAAQSEIETGLPPRQDTEARHLRQVVARVSDGIVLVNPEQSIS